jgi:hypothetical protein
MNQQAGRLGLIAIGLAAAVWLLTAVAPCPADDDEEKTAKEVREKVLKLAGAIEKKDAKAQKKVLKELDELYKKQVIGADIEDIMGLLSLRTKDGKGGLGIGKKPGANKNDGIEAKLRDHLVEKELSKEELAKQGADLARAAYVMAAVADFTVDKDKRAGWILSAKDMSKNARNLAAQLQAKKADRAKIKEAAAKLYANCLTCHGVVKAGAVPIIRP